MCVRIVVACFFLFSGWSTVFARQVEFIENKCQWPDEVKYKARIPGGTMQLQQAGFSYTFIDQQHLDHMHELGHESHNESAQAEINLKLNGHRVDVLFKEANKNVQPQPVGRLSQYYNYFLGADRSMWASRAGAFEGVYYPAFYNGIDLKVYSAGRNIKYDFYVAAGADPLQIAFEYSGTDRVYLSDGDLKISASQFEFTEKKPVAWQWINGKKVFVECAYALLHNKVSFAFPQGYDACYPLTIDPLLIFSTYSGSTADNWGSTATPGEHGNLYSAGVTSHNLGGFFPATAGAFQTSIGGAYDVAVIKYDSAGTQMLYATYLGGSHGESPHSLIMDADENLWILGTTSSDNFPVTAGVIDDTYNGGISLFNVIPYENGSDIFVAKLSADGSDLLASTYLGGSANDGLNPANSPLVRNYGDELRGDIIVDANGNIYISTVTQSADFTGKDSFSNAYQGGLTDAIVMHLNASLTEIYWSAFLGGSGADASHTIKLNEEGDVWVAGGTASPNFPTTAGVYQPTLAGGVDGWMAKIMKDGSAIMVSGLTGTAQYNQVYFIDLDNNENVYVYGQTVGAFPVTAGVFSNPNSGQFLQKFDKDLTTLLFSTVFGAGRGIPDISPTAFLVNDCNNIYMSGWGGAINISRGFWNSGTSGMPITSDAYQKTTAGSDFYFIVLTDDASEMLYGTFLGGNQSPVHVDGGTSRFDKGGIVYHSVCGGCGAGFDDFPTTPNAWSQLNQSQNCNNAAFKFDLSSLKARIQTNNITFDMPGLNRVCIPDPIVFQNLSTGGRIYEWSFGDGGQVVRQDTSFIMHRYNQPGTYRVKLLAIDAGTCVGMDSTFTQVVVTEAAGEAGPDVDMCFGAGTRLTATGGVAYEWINYNRTFSTTDQSPVVNPAEDEDYIVSIFDFNGCSKKDTVHVRVIPGVELDFSLSKMYDCFNRPTIAVENLLPAADEQVFFDFGDGNTSDREQALHTFQQDGTYAVKLVGVKETCVYEKVMSVPVYELKVPNVITPDEFPENNQFVIQYGGNKLSASGFAARVVIVNRWGKKVFESNNYQDDWDAGNVEAGMYFYEIRIPGEAVCKGWLQVIK
ncbi:MAG: gliding motility-associated C-terminal domain-containing protein [Cyclobacteriaceae bacterium]|nr:gliding motility-associated C-terminal domain-containing protein [Cyclobacteriaceae bacterium]